MTEFLETAIERPRTGPAPEPLPGGRERRSIPVRRAAVWLRRRLGLVAGGTVVLLVLAWAVAPSVFASGDPLRGIPAQKLRAPSTEHWFGTDNLGRDLYTRVVHGTGLSVSATVFAVMLGSAVGSLLGLVAGGAGGALDTAIMRVVDVLLSIPDLLVALAMITVLGLGTRNVSIAVGVSLIARFARVMRGEVLRVRRAPYVEAAFAAGVRWHRVLFRHVLRNAHLPVAALAAVDFGVAVLFVATLGFLGYGAVPPTPEWGSLVSDGRGFLATAWWLTTLPGVVIVVLVLSTQRVARALQKEESL
ncbi:ABC transporter permease [Nocardia seriolae]|uniref:ABC transporter permease n=1 Tax=Nocardia seriolae TaxID=37332 RepID=UPI00051A6B34|nr:ABC transporter permease [Nocardia seriolae]MTJ60265.1 ABC transporter permease subunit [Nocardia seriolae]MTJ73117.1 ABC transporter permease subunit [Nocardia seriolae]MTJ85257.1 ABC transporter permease subunit [Nocardia seriolae]MTK29253.1 ABC transporter permease subunit [Nocardia seriolae]MTK38195.1 ABC transporter permease subunit [Nocardia seriolae]